MGKRKNISAVISLRDNMSATLRGIAKEQTRFESAVRKTTKEIQKQREANQKDFKMKLDNTKAMKGIKAIKTALEPLKQQKIVRIATREANKARRKQIIRDLKSIANKKFAPIISIKDHASSKIKSITKGLMSFKGLAVVGGAGMAAKALLGAGSQLEQQKISMNHFMGVGNKGKSQGEINKMSSSYLKSLRDNANATPFETGEVVQAGTRSLQIAGGNSKEAMKMVRLAEDMAAMNPGKTVSDAMEALADAKTGEMERLKEFGVKASSKDSFDSVKGQLSNLYEGGAEKLAQSGTGLWSTLVGKLKSNMADTGEGILEKMKPALEGAISLVDRLSPVFSQVGSMMSEGIGSAIGFIQSQMPTIVPMVQSAFESVKSIITTVGPVIMEAVKALWPVFQFFGQVAVTAMGIVAGAVRAAAPIVTTLIHAIAPVINAVVSALRTMGHVFSSVFSTVKRVVKGAYDFIKPVIDGIGGLLSKVGDGINAVSNFFSGGGGPEQNATGTEYFKGGWSIVGEHGPELVQMPRGSKVMTNQSLNMLARQNSQKREAIFNSNNQKNITNKKEHKTVININKLIDHAEIKDSRSVDDITSSIVQKLAIELTNYGGAILC